jgi:hypothetical protein
MRVKATRTKFEDCPPLVAQMGFPKTILHISVGKEYEVFALSVFKGAVILQILTDLNIIGWVPAWFFEICDKSMPTDWVCNMFELEPSLVIGPDFITTDISAYTSMVELDDDQIQKFWQRFESIYKDKEEES